MLSIDPSFCYDKLAPRERLWLVIQNDYLTKGMQTNKKLWLVIQEDYLTKGMQTNRVVFAWDSFHSLVKTWRCHRPSRWKKLARHRFSKYPCLDQRSYLPSIPLSRLPSLRNVRNISPHIYKKSNHYISQNVRVCRVNL